MQLKPLGQTSLQVSPLGLGTVKFGRNTQVKYPTHFTLPSDNDICNLLAIAREHGINLLDTAPAYGNSEERLGQLLKKQRKDWIIMTKVGEEFVNNQSVFNFTPQHLRTSIERSLKRLNTDYLDGVIVHSDGNDCQIIEQYSVFRELQQLKQQGFIRSFGMSTKTVAGGLASVSQADMVMVTYHPHAQEERAVLDAAAQNHCGILIKKAFASGHLDNFNVTDPITHIMQFIFQHPAVTSIILGTINPQHLLQNITAYHAAKNNIE